MIPATPGNSVPVPGRGIPRSAAREAVPVPANWHVFRSSAPHGQRPAGSEVRAAHAGPGPRLHGRRGPRHRAGSRRQQRHVQRAGERGPEAARGAGARSPAEALRGRALGRARSLVGARLPRPRQGEQLVRGGRRDPERVFVPDHGRRPAADPGGPGVRQLLRGARRAPCDGPRVHRRGRPGRKRPRRRSHRCSLEARVRRRSPHRRAVGRPRRAQHHHRGRDAAAILLSPAAPRPCSTAADCTGSRHSAGFGADCPCSKRRPTST